MNKFLFHSGIVAPLDRANVDTDAIIPKQYLKSIKRTGFGQYLFDESRYLGHSESDPTVETRQVNPTFVLNFPRYSGASILLTRGNFGCGSSREHAVWAVQQYGFRVVIAPSFAEIFRTNCLKNGLLPVVLEDSAIDDIFALAEAVTGFSLSVDLEVQTVTTALGETYPFAITPFQKDCLLNGVDDIASTLKRVAKIQEFEERSFALQPWNRLRIAD